MLEGRAIRIAYPGGAPVTRALDFSLRPGEFCALTGKNGSGKSLLALTLSGLIPPFEGVLTLDGHRFPSPERDRSQIAVLFQDPDSQLVTGNIESEIAFPIENLGWDRERIERRVGEVIDRLQLAHLIGRPLGGLSGGEKSWVTLAASLASSPRYLLLDEPGVFLDPRARERLRTEVQSLVDDGVGVLWITQFEEEWRGAQRHLVLEESGISAAAVDHLAGQEEGKIEARELPGVNPRSRAGSGGEPEPLATGPVVLRAEGVEFRHAEIESGPSPDPSSKRQFSLGPISLTLAAGERLFLRGESGSGKTTLLLLLAGVLEPMRGRITYKTFCTEGREGSDFAVLLQSPEDQLVSPTVEEDILLGLKLRGLVTEDSQPRARESLRAMGLDPTVTASLPPGSLSHGQRRRIAWCGIWVLDARVWLLDEPTAGLDGEGVRVLKDATDRFLEDEGAIVLVTQDPRLQSWGGRNLLLKNGHPSPSGEADSASPEGPEIANFP